MRAKAPRPFPGDHPGGNTTGTPPPEPEKDTTPEQDAEILKLLDSRQVRLAYPPPKPIPIITLAGQCVSTAEGLTVLSGQAKSGKTAVLTAIVAAPFAKPGSDLLGFAGPTANGKAVVVVDTEQSGYDAWRFQQRTLSRAGLSVQPENLRHYHLVGLSPAERIKALLAEFARAALDCGGIQMGVIDGVADLVDDVNESGECIPLINDVLMGLAVKYACPLILILHENPAYGRNNEAKTRGHLGSHLERKAESNLKMLKDASGVTTLYGERCRNLSLPKAEGVCFQWDDDLKRHVSCGTAAAAKQEAKRSAQEIEVARVFADQSGNGAMTWSGLVAAIESKLRVGRKAAEAKVKKWTQERLIRKNGAGIYLQNHE